jgi:Predicted dehydrogenases and related proteins
VSAPLPIGVVGVGALGRHHARHLAQLDEARLVGVFDTDPARARSVAEELGTTAFSSLDALLDQAEAVTVAVPTPAHHAVGTQALGRGVPVLMEKPLAATVAEADALIAAARGAGSSSKSATSSATTARSAPRSPTSTGPDTSRASGWPRSSPGAPTWPSCSTS